jgi:hypothetical protein
VNPPLYISIANWLLQRHYGLDVGDTSIGSPTVARTLVSQGVRPFEAVNAHAQACKLDRIDTKGRFGVPSRDPLTSQDELAALALVRPVQLLGDQPTCCGYCGTRTEFDVLDDGRQHHRCPNDWCGAEFVAEEDDDPALTH